MPLKKGRTNAQSVDEIRPREIVLRNFDPNLITLEEGLSLGMEEKVIRTLMKFRERGGVFREKADLKKIYGLNNQLYAELEPFISIASLEKDTVGPEVTVRSKPFHPGGYQCR